MSIYIVGWGATPTRPDCAVNNQQVLQRILANLEPGSDDYTQIASLTGEAITDKLGIVERQYYNNPDDPADPRNRSSFQLALEAAQQALPTADLPSIFQPELIVSGGSSPDNLYPGGAPYLQHHLGYEPVEGFDVSLACSSGSQAVIEACRCLLAEDKKYALVALGETVGSVTNYYTSQNALLWGDGGAAWILHHRQNAKGDGFMKWGSWVDGSQADTTLSRGQGSAHIHRTVAHLDNSMEGRGRDIQTWILRDVSAHLGKFLDSCDFQGTVKLVPHNGNLKMVNGLAQRVGIPIENVYHRIADRGNQSSVGVLSSYAYHMDNEAFKPGDELIFVTFGGGLAWNFIHYRQPSL